jgi:hypothetical protein
MSLSEGALRAVLDPGPKGSRLVALVEIENGATRVRGHVALDELRVHLTTAFEARPGLVPDGRTQRPVIGVEGDLALVELRAGGVVSTAAEVPCSDLGVMPVDLVADAIFPEAGGEVVVRSDAVGEWSGEVVRAAGLSVWPRSSRPQGVLGTLRGKAPDGRGTLVSFRICGATVLARFRAADLLGPPVIYHGSSGRCPGWHSGYFVEPAKLRRPITCPRDVALFVRTESMEDAVGVLKAGARFQVEGVLRDTTAITVEGSAATILNHATFSVRSADIEGCDGS